jgi:hypothetical protein
VVGDAAVLAALAADVLGLPLPGGSLQNGDPDGVSLELDGQIIDSMSYGGAMAGISEGASAVTDNGVGALGRDFAAYR